MPPLLLSPPGIYLATFLVSLVGGIVPFLNVEAYLVAMSALSPEAGMVPSVLAATGGQMTAKALLYLAGGGLLRLPLGRRAGRMREAAERMAGGRGRAASLILLSAVTGIPPFYGVSLAAGLLRLPFGVFLVAGCVGRVARFAMVFLLPRLWA